ncbi:glycosyltransferase [Lacticigenium naphthae]|uniref:glycosyltransferase n=1 Tax=Lacticigenium naphthae TaxID=515351 RepID=UPI0003F8B245|nr:glycosyltransferase family 2 protein [Lacticigenium naphthae]
MSTVLISAIIGTLVCELVFVWWNHYNLPKPSDYKRDPQQSTRSSISILIPARDEEKNIEACIQAVMKQTVVPKEVLVLDDHSTDQTPAILEKLQKEFTKLRVVRGKELPEGWVGKSFACHQLAQEATGDWYLFIDADARLKPKAIEKLLPVIETEEPGIISGFPQQIVKTWGEKLVVPLMLVAVMMHLPIKYIKKSHDPLFSAAHGGFVAIERNAYHNSGGHEAVKESLVEDMDLFKRQKQLHNSATLLNVDTLVKMRMYEDFRSVWFGYQKNFFANLDRKSSLLSLVLLYYFTLFILPLVLIKEVPILLVGIAYALGVLVKYSIDRMHGIPGWISFLMPLSVVLLIGIGLDSMLQSVTKKGYSWKGRQYQ